MMWFVVAALVALVVGLELRSRRQDRGRHHAAREKPFENDRHLTGRRHLPKGLRGE